MEHLKTDDNYKPGGRWVDKTSLDVWERREGPVMWKYLGKSASSHPIDVISVNSHNEPHEKDVVKKIKCPHYGYPMVFKRYQEQEN